MKINCDQVTWIKDALHRYYKACSAAEGMSHVSRLPAAARLAGLLEIMEILGLTFEDQRAVHNATIGLKLVMDGEAPDNWGNHHD